MVVSQKKLQLYNQFDYQTKEDLLYFILFSFEQLNIEPETVKLKLFGAIEKDDPVYDICYNYIKDISVITPPYPSYVVKENNGFTDFTLLNSL